MRSVNADRLFGFSLQTHKGSGLRAMAVQDVELK